MVDQIKKALYGEVISLGAYYEVLKRLKSEKEMEYLLKIISDNHTKLNFWRKQLKLHPTTDLSNLDTWEELEGYASRVKKSVHRSRVATNLLQAAELKKQNYLRLLRNHQIDSSLKQVVEQQLIPMQRNSEVVLKTLFKAKA